MSSVYYIRNLSIGNYASINGDNAFAGQSICGKKLCAPSSDSQKFTLKSQKGVVPYIIALTQPADTFCVITDDLNHFENADVTLGSTAANPTFSWTFTSVDKYPNAYTITQNCDGQDYYWTLRSDGGPIKLEGVYADETAKKQQYWVLEAATL